MSVSVMNTKLLITNDMIKEMYDRTTYQRGLTYFNQRRVTEIRYNEARNTWLAEVEGTRLYKVGVELFDQHIYTSCSCPAYKQYGECKHEVAVLLELMTLENKTEFSKQMEIRQKNREYEDTKRLIDAFSQQQYIDTNRLTFSKKQIMLQFILKRDSVSPTYGGSYLTIEMRAGVERLYVVKKIKDFIGKTVAQESFVFTPKFSYDPTEHFFDQEDLEIVHMLQAIIKNEKLYRVTTSNDYWHNNSAEDGRDLIIPPMAAETLLLKLKNKDVQVEYATSTQNRIDIQAEGLLPFSYTIDKGNDKDFTLHIQGLQEAILFESYGIIFYQDVFYKLSIEQLQRIKEMKALINNRKGNAITIANEQIAPFLSHVEPVLKRIGTISIDDSISNQIIAPDLHAKLFVDYNQEQLHVKVEYHYGETVINPFQSKEIKTTKEQEQVILMRDVVKEQEIMEVIESAPLKYNGKELYVEEEEDLYQFLFQSMPQLEDKAEIFFTNSAKTLILPEEHKPVVSVEMDASENWLEIGFDMDGIANQDIHSILQSVVEKKKYYRLPNGAFVSLDDEEFATIHKLVNELELSKTELEDNKIKRPVFRGLQIEGMLGDKYHPNVQFGKAFRRFMNLFKNPDQLDVEIPSSIQATLRDYQTFGFQWLKTLAHYRLGGILADDMGLGKTLQSIVFITSEIEEKRIGTPVLIVAPASLIYNWKNEFDKFSPTLEVKIVDGTPEEREKLLQATDQPDVWITSYPMLRQDSEIYHQKGFSTLILDEAQAIKNPTTKIFKAVQQVKADRRFALSGTPIENTIDELWAIFQVVLPGFFPNKMKFRNLSHDKIAKMVRPFILRRVKKDVLKELPDKIETVQVSELTKEQKEIYIGYLERIQQETRESIQQEGFNKSRIKILAGLTRLRQICNHPSLFLEQYNGESSKLEQLMELVDTSIANGNRLLIFSQFSSMLQMIRERLEAEGYQPFYLDGQTPTKERVVMAEQFNQGEKEIFLVSLKAGGTGLNLTGADTVILFDLWWNPAVEEQAAGRAHRIGQKKVVQVIRLISHGTIEEKIYKMQQRKKELIEKVIQPGEQMLTSLTEEDILELLNG